MQILESRSDLHNEGASLLIDQSSLADLVIELTRYQDLFRPSRRTEVASPAQAGEPGSQSAPDYKPLQKLPPGPWRSLGGYFDYSKWSERDRFLELDHAILATSD
jgi:hypothetical protein